MLEIKMAASDLWYREFEVQLDPIEQERAAFRRELANAKNMMSTAGRRILRCTNRQGSHKAEMDRLLEKFVTLRAKDRSVAVL